MNIKETRIYQLLRQVYIRLFRNPPKNYYISKVSRKAPWVYIAYISEVFYHLHDESILTLHQNMKEAIEMVNVFNEMGYNVYVQSYLSRDKIPRINPQIIIGHEPNMARASMLYPNAWKIYYATGSYGAHQNHQIKKMTDYVNQKYDSQIPYRRLVDDSIFESYKLADDILMIGSKYSQDTFPDKLIGKITRIHQSTQLLKVEKEIQYARPNEFFFMGSSGNLLKGIPLLLEYFSEHKELTLNIVGPIEEDVERALRRMMTNNIVFHGWLNVNSAEMAEIVSRCNFIVYPSGSEGGMPGAVLNSMKFGLIPIVTKWAAFDEIEDYGYLMNEWSTESIHQGIAWAMSMSAEMVLNYKIKCAEYVNQTYTLATYKKELSAFFSNRLQCLV